jgi:hypothetical protein
MARLPVPQATSSTRIPASIGSRWTNAFASGAEYRAIWPKSPAIHVLRIMVFNASNPPGAGCMDTSNQHSITPEDARFTRGNKST